MAAETILDPDQKICDPHHHLMDNDWARYLLGDLLSDVAAGHRVVSTLYMETGDGYRDAGPEKLRPVGEVEHVLAQPAPPGIMQGIVAFADLRLGDDVEEVLDAHEAVAGARFSGIRFMSAWDVDPAFNLLHFVDGPGILSQPGYRRGARAVGRRGLPIDCWVFGHQLADVEQLARALPDQVFVIDHLGSPLVGGGYRAQRAQRLADWRRQLQAVAQCPNVLLKIGGLTLEMQGSPWKPGDAPTSLQIAETWQADVRWCIDTFGPVRCMFESNFPIDRMVTDYVTLWNAFKRIAAPYSVAERNALFHDNAVRTYLQRQPKP